MGQKVNPKAYRLGVIKTWNSKWFSKKKFPQQLKEDILIRNFLKNKLKGMGLIKTEIERSAEKIKITLYTAKPGLIIGRGGKGADELKNKIRNYLPKDVSLEVAIQEPEQAEISSQIILEGMIADLERRVPYRRVLKWAIEQGKKAGVKGIKVSTKGRLDGIEIAREEHLSWGKMPLHTLRADIDYSRGTAFTTYGTIGVKVWIYKGEVFEKQRSNEATK
jgi:small subunit ribosomal protein S3